jgi:uncharacterized protein (TIGR03437 family)
MQMRHRILAVCLSVFFCHVAAILPNVAFAQSPAATPSVTFGGIAPVGSTTPTIQPGEWVSIYGTNFASSTVTWTGNFPISLGGTSVTINGKAAYLSFVSPTQINLQAPDDTSTGSVPVVVTTANGTATGTVTLAQFTPSFLLLDSKHVTGIILRSNGSGAYDGGAYDIIGPTGNSLGYPTVAATAGDNIELFAVGLGPTDPVELARQAFSGAAPTTNTVKLLINSVSVTPSFAGLSSAGLYQINLIVPAGLGTGDVSLVATVGGEQTQPGVVISLPGPQILSLTLSANSVASGGTVTGTVVLSAGAPSGGAVVTLTTGQPAAASVPASVTVPAGVTSATFTVSAGTLNCTQTATIAAFYDASSAVASLTVTPPANAPPASTLAPGDELQATFTSVPNTSNLLLFFNNDALTLAGSPVTTTELFNGTNSLGSIVSAPSMFEGTSFFGVYFMSPSSTFVPPPGQSTVVDLTSMQNGTIQGLLKVTVSGGSISGFCLSDFVLYDAQGLSNGYRPERDLRNINITLSSTH